MEKLNSAAIKYLKSQAHHLDPVVLIGQNGLTDSVIAKTDQVLTSHELIKVKFLDFKEEKKELIGKLTDSTDSQFVGMVGHVATLYRPNPEEDKRKIRLPQ